MSEPRYCDQHVVCNVRKDGDVKLDGKHIFVSSILSDERIGVLKAEEEL